MGWLRGLAVNEIVRCTTRLGVGLWWGFPAVLCRAVAFAARFPVFATRRGIVVFPTFPGGFRMPGLRGWPVSCKLTLRCRSASGSPAGVLRGG